MSGSPVVKQGLPLVRRYYYNKPSPFREGYGEQIYHNFIVSEKKFMEVFTQ